MKMRVMGVKRVAGTSKKTGNDFDMNAVICEVPIEPVKTATFEIEGYGFEPAEIPLAEGALSLFRDVKFPCELDLATDQRHYRGKIETFVIGINKPVAAVRAG